MGSAKIILCSKSLQDSHVASFAGIVGLFEITLLLFSSLFKGTAFSASNGMGLNHIKSLAAGRSRTVTAAAPCVVLYKRRGKLPSVFFSCPAPEHTRPCLVNEVARLLRERCLTVLMYSLKLAEFFWGLLMLPSTSFFLPSFLPSFLRVWNNSAVDMND